MAIFQAGLLAGLPGAGEAFASLRLAAHPEKARVVLGEPVVLFTAVANTTGAPIVAHRELDPAIERIQISVEPPEGRFRRWLGPHWGVSERKPESIPIGGGETLRGRAVLLYHTAVRGHPELLHTSLPFGRPGRYRLRVEFADVNFDRRVAAPEFTVQVVEPLGADLAAWNALQATPELGYFAQTGDARRGPGVVRIAERLAAAQPGAALVRHLEWALGRYHLNRGRPEGALPRLRRAASAPPKSLIRGMALLELVRWTARNGPQEERQRLCRAAGAEYRETSLAAEFASLCPDAQE